MNDYSAETIEHISSLNLESRQQLGQFMTPHSIGVEMAKLFTIPNFSDEPLKVLDPAVGTAELIRAFKTVHGESGFEFHGWDIDSKMLAVASASQPGIFTKQRSLFSKLDSQEESSFDLIIANPPYFELKKDNKELANSDLTLKDSKGRINIYALFFEYALKLLKPGGQLVFLVPPSMNNGAYFKQLRKLILEQSEIQHLELIEENNRFADALTSVQLIKLQKNSAGYKTNKKSSTNFLVDFNEVVPEADITLPVVFTTKRKEILKAWQSAKSLHELGYKVVTGRTLWNKNKEQFLSASSSLPVAPLIYAKDISKHNELLFLEKLNTRRYLLASRADIFQQDLVVVNRIVGSLEAPRIKAALVLLKDYPSGVFCENHVNVIVPRAEPLQIKLETVVQQLANVQRLSQYIKALTGNTQISATELEYLIPIMVPRSK